LGSRTHDLKLLLKRINQTSGRVSLVFAVIIYSDIEIHCLESQWSFFIRIALGLESALTPGQTKLDDFAKAKEDFVVS